MNIYSLIDNIEYDKITLYKPILNKIAHYKYFYKIIYNLDNFTLNSILFKIDAYNIDVIKEGNSYKLSFLIIPSFLEKIKMFETKILTNINTLIQKQITMSCYKYLSNAKHIYTDETHNQIYLRISGIWESDTHIGFTSKLSCY